MVSPFIGRLDDISQDGMALIAEILAMYKPYGYKTSVLVSSIRHPIHIVQAAKLGAPIATMPFKVLEMRKKSTSRCSEFQNLRGSSRPLGPVWCLPP